MNAFLTSEGLLALVTLTFLEIVLGIDNVIFISILSGKLPASEQPRARRVGLLGAMLMRIALLFSIAWVVQLTEPLFSIAGWDISGRALILISGGSFLLVKATLELHERLEGEEHQRQALTAVSFGVVIGQIMLLDIVFSLDSVITAVGMADDVAIMVAEFVGRHPTIKVLALSFLLLIGMSLVADGLGLHIPKGYVYFAMGFSVFVEIINLRVRRHPAPVKLRDPRRP